MLFGVSGWTWSFLATILFIYTFGVYSILYVLLMIAGSLSVAFHYGKQKSLEILSLPRPRLKPPNNGIQKVMEKMENITKIKNFDRRMTGAANMDSVLQDVLEYTLRDYIKTWYHQISEHDGFLVDIWQCVQKSVITFSNRSKEIDWLPFFTNRMVDDFASHIRLHRRASDKLLLSKSDKNVDIESLFFDLEVEMENNMCRDLVSTSPDCERQYLQDLSEVLLFLLLPKEDFQNKVFRFILREILVNGVFLPTIDMVSDPDYFNQTVAWWCKETTLTNEMFLTVLKTSVMVEELHAVKEKVEKDINKWRSQDTGGDDDTLIKQNLNSLMFVLNTCDARIKRINEGADDSEFQEDSELGRILARGCNLFIMSLDDIINNNIALQSFIEFLRTVSGEPLLFFYLNVEGFRTAAEQQINMAREKRRSSEPELESLRRAANIIYDQYLSDKASSRIRVDEGTIKRTLRNIKDKQLSEDIFDEVQAKVYRILHGEKYYESFLQSSQYIKLLDDLNLLPQRENEETQSEEINAEPDEDAPLFGRTSSTSSYPEEDTISTGSGASVDSSQMVDIETCTFTAQIAETGIIKEELKAGKKYAVYAITVRRRDADGNEDIWDVYRRYSDFHDLHAIIIDKYDSISGLILPGKTAFKHMNQEFLDKRKKALDVYLKTLLQAEVLYSHPGFLEIIVNFLSPKVWEKHKSRLSSKMNPFVNPIKSSMKHATSAARGIPEGTSRFQDAAGGSPTFRSSAMAGGKVGAGLDTADAENIPLRIMLLLMDEVFDLKNKHQWLRRRIVAILRQLVKATFGDKINRKIIDHVELMTSSDQMAEYIKNCRDTFWPMGILAESMPPRDINTKMRTRVVCKAKMLGSVSDEMRHLMGNDTIRRGVFRVFDMFQHRALNRRLVYVVLEGVLETMFPDNKFPDIFRKLHSRSPRVTQLPKDSDIADSR